MCPSASPAVYATNPSKSQSFPIALAGNSRKDSHDPQQVPYVLIHGPTDVVREKTIMLSLLVAMVDKDIAKQVTRNEFFTGNRGSITQRTDKNSRCPLQNLSMIP